MKSATLNKQGRVVIPQEIRDEFNFKPGDKLIFRNDHGKLVVETSDAVHERIWALCAQPDSDACWSEDLIAERREEARKELAEMAIDKLQEAS